MPLYDSYHSRLIFAEFTMREEFDAFPPAERFALSLIANGETTLEVNDIRVVLTSPCVFLTSRSDKVKPVDSHKLRAQSFSFHPRFLNKDLTFERLAGKDFQELSDEHDCSLLNLFLPRDGFSGGIIKLQPQTFLQFTELFGLIGREMETKSSEHWPYHVRRYLILILFLLQDAYISQKNSKRLTDESMIDIILDYMYTNYSRNISIETLCRLVYVNRTTLTRKFKARTGKTPIDYLLYHRLNIACELLTHSKLSISKIAEESGFKYETYFIRQFKAKIGITPAEYRQSDGFETLNVNESRIIDEF